MSTASISSFTFAPQQVIIYLGTFILIAGVFGGILNIIVFLSLDTFRKNSCAFYLTAMSFFNIAHLTTTLLQYIITNGYGIDWPASSIFYCKFVYYLIQLWFLNSFTCMCLATVDQFLATCFNPFWHRLSNVKLARYVLASFFSVWLLHGIPFAIYYNVIISPISYHSTCSIINIIFQRYNSFGYVLILMGALPLALMVLFGSLAYYNVRNLAYRTVPLVRRELDKQLTQMVLVQVIYNCFVLTPFVISNVITLNLPYTDKIHFITSVAIIIHTSYFASPFYIYVCVSKRFRQQLNHVLCNIHLNRWRERNLNNNQVLPQPAGISINNNN